MSQRDCLLAEGVGTAFLLAIVVGSGIMGETLSAGNTAVALLANSVATGAGLVTLILVCGPISGAHFNPAVTLTLALRRQFAWADVPGYVAAQCAGAVAGVIAAHAMFGWPLLEIATRARPGLHLAWSEFVATTGLLLTIMLCSRHRPGMTPFAVAAFIVAAYWFTASTSFANPAVTLARAFTDSFCGIRPADVAGFLVGQAAAVALLASWPRHSASPKEFDRAAEDNGHAHRTDS